MTVKMIRVNQAEYRPGRRYGACDFRAGVFQPQAFTGEPADFRQGYVDGWDDAAERAGQPASCLCGRPEAEPGSGYCDGFLSGQGPCTTEPYAV